LEVHWDSNSHSGSPFGSVWVHSLTPSYVLKNIKYDSWASLLALTFISLCFTRELKVKVMAGWQRWTYCEHLMWEGVVDVLRWIGEPCPWIGNNDCRGWRGPKLGCPTSVDGESWPAWQTSNNYWQHTSRQVQRAYSFSLQPGFTKKYHQHTIHI